MDRRRNADAANGKPGKADQDQKAADPVDKLFNARSGIAAVGPAQTLVAEAGHGLVFQHLKVGCRGQQQPVAGFIHRALGKEAGIGQGRGVNHRAGAKGKAGRGAVRLAGQGGGQTKVLGAKAKAVADHQAKPFDQDRVHDRAGQAVREGQRLGQRDRRVQGGSAGQGPGIVDRLDLRQRLIVLKQDHRAEVVDFRYSRRDAGHIGTFVGIGASVGKAHLGVTAKDHCALIGQALLNAGAQGADSSDGRDAKGEAGKEHAKAAQAAAQFAPGDGESEAHSAAACRSGAS